MGICYNGDMAKVIMIFAKKKNLFLMILQHANPHTQYIACFTKKINTLCMWICHSEAGTSACQIYYQFYPRDHVGPGIDFQTV